MYVFMIVGLCHMDVTCVVLWIMSSFLYACVSGKREDLCLFPVANTLVPLS